MLIAQMAPTARQWFRIQMIADDPLVADVFIFDIIGDWIDDLWGFDGLVTTAKSFQRALESLPTIVKTIRLHVNSPGGDVFSAVTIANMLRDQRTTKGRQVETLIEGLAASAASIVIQAGDPIRIGDNALVMVHNPWSIAFGDAGAFRKAAWELDTIRDAIVATYRWHSTLSADDLVALMDATTWMDADAAIANGFATEKIDGFKATASLDPRARAKLTIPEQYRARVDALLKPQPVTPPAAGADQVLEAAAAAGLDTAFARQLLKDALPMDQVTARVAAEQETRRQTATRVSEIRALCQTARLPQYADDFIKSPLSVAHVRTELTTLTAMRDHVEVDSSLPAGGTTRPTPVLDVAAIYAARTQPRSN